MDFVYHCLLVLLIQYLCTCTENFYPQHVSLFALAPLPYCRFTCRSCTDMDEPWMHPFGTTAPPLQSPLPGYRWFDIDSADKSMRPLIASSSTFSGEAAGIGLPLEAACGSTDPKSKDCSNNRWTCGTSTWKPVEMCGLMWYKLWLKRSWIFGGATRKILACTCPS